MPKNVSRKNKGSSRKVIQEEEGEYSIQDDEPDNYTESDLDDDELMKIYEDPGKGNFIRLHKYDNKVRSPSNLALCFIYSFVSNLLWRGIIVRSLALMKKR